MILESLVGSLDSTEALTFVRGVLEQFASRSAGTHVSHDVALLLLRVLSELFLSASDGSNVASLKPKVAQKLLTFEGVSALVSTYRQVRACVVSRAERVIDVGNHMTEMSPLWKVTERVGSSESVYRTSFVESDTSCGSDIAGMLTIVVPDKIARAIASCVAS